MLLRQQLLYQTIKFLLHESENCRNNCDVVESEFLIQTPANAVKRLGILAYTETQLCWISHSVKST